MSFPFRVCTCLFSLVRLLSIGQRDIAIVDILILLSSATPLISFVFFLFLLVHVPPAVRSFTSSFYQSINLSSSLPGRFFILPLLVDRTCSFVHRLTLASFIVIRDLPFPFSPCLLRLPRHHFFSFSPRLLLPLLLLRFSSSVFSSFYVILRISCLLSLSPFYYILLLFFIIFFLYSLFFSYISMFLCPLSSFLIFF